MDTLGTHRNNSGIHLQGLHSLLTAGDHSRAPHHGSGRGLHNEVICTMYQTVTLELRSRGLNIYSHLGKYARCALVLTLPLVPAGH